VCVCMCCATKSDSRMQEQRLPLRGRSGLSLYETEKKPSEATVHADRLVSFAIACRSSLLPSNRLDTRGSFWLKAATKAEAEAWNDYRVTSNQMT
jgi:hypothetical protein